MLSLLSHAFLLMALRLISVFEFAHQRRRLVVTLLVLCRLLFVIPLAHHALEGDIFGERRWLAVNVGGLREQLVASQVQLLVV